MINDILLKTVKNSYGIELIDERMMDCKDCAVRNVTHSYTNRQLPKDDGIIRCWSLDVCSLYNAQV